MGRYDFPAFIRHFFFSSNSESKIIQRSSLTSTVDAIPRPDYSQLATSDDILEGEALHLYIARNAFFFIVIVLLCLTVGAFLKKYRADRYLPASAAAIIIGFIIGGILTTTSDIQQAAFSFSPQVFFFLLLPPIMIEAGYTCRRKQFFKNAGAISMYAFAGTLVSCLSFGFILWIFTQLHVIPLDSRNPIECLMFGSLISATDPVAVLAMLNSPQVKVPPTLYALIFGESMLNDAIAIVLFNTFEQMLTNVDADGNVNFTALTFFEAIGHFVLISIGSTIVGFAVSLVCGFITKRINFKNYPAYEVTLIILFSWLSYFVAEAIHLSGIMSIFFTAIGLAHYAYYNVSPKAQLTTHEAFKSIAQVAEIFVFAYIGIRVGLSTATTYSLKWDVPFIIVSICAVFLSRATHVFPLTWICNRFRTDKISIGMQIPIWWAGLRGAVAVALSLSFPNPNGEYVITSTLCIVLTTTILCGGTTVPILNFTKMNAPTVDESTSSASTASSVASSSTSSLLGDSAALRGTVVATNSSGHHDSEDGHGHDDDDEPTRPQDGQTYNKWLLKFRKFDRTFMRKWFGGNIKSSLLPEEALHAQNANGAINGDMFADLQERSQEYVPPSMSPHMRGEEHEPFKM